MAGVCQACRENIIVTQKRIKCTACSLLYHSECIKYNKDSTTRTQWKCPNCVAAQRKGGNNSDTPVCPSDKTQPQGKESTLCTPTEGTSSASPSSTPIQPLNAQAQPSIAQAQPQNTQETGPAPHLSEDAGESARPILLTELESLLDTKLNKMKIFIIEELKTTIASEIRKELSAINSSLSQLEGSHNDLLNDHESLKKNFDSLQKHVQQSDCLIADLQAQLNKQQQWARLSNLEVIGLPESSNESPTQIFVKIAKHAGVTLLPEEIESAHRVQPMHKLAGQPKPLVVKLRSRMVKDQIISGLRKTKGIVSRDIGIGGSTRRFFVNEHLTPQNKNLLRCAKLRAKENSYKFVWVKNCNIFVRKNEESPVINIQTEKDLEKIT